MMRTRIVAAVIAGLASVAAVGCVPEAPGGGGTGGWVAAGCFDAPAADIPDLNYSGTPNVVGNLSASVDPSTFALSTNGTCAGVPLGAPNNFTLVRAADAAAAAGACTTLGLDNGVSQVNAEYPAFPADAWVCNPVAAESN
jgi:hypothetical protein